jgi:hypothetical protein
LAASSVGLGCLMMLAWVGSADALVATVSPSATVGVANTEAPTQAGAGGVPQPGPSGTDGFAGINLAAELRLTRATSVHRVGYGFRLIHYFADPSTTDQSQSASWLSDFTLGPGTTLQLGANGSLYGFNTLFANNPAAASVGSTLPVDSRVVGLDAIQSLSYQPSGAQRYGQSLVAGYVRPLEDSSSVPRTLRVAGTVRGERITGVNAYSLNLMAEELRILSDAPVPPPGQLVPPADQVLTLEGLVGWRRELSVTTNVDVEAGAMTAIGVTDSAVWAPALLATASYRRLPWYATLSASQQPIVNAYLGQVLLADGASLRMLLPLDARESWVAVALAGYTYARLFSPTHDLVLSDRAYGLVQLGLSLAYRFPRLPFFASLDYADLDQSGSTTDEGVFPTSHRRLLSVSFGGNFAWGEGNHGLARPEEASHP